VALVDVWPQIVEGDYSEVDERMDLSSSVIEVSIDGSSRAGDFSTVWGSRANTTEGELEDG